MSVIDRTGTWRGIIQSSAYSETKKGFPQAVLQLLATERYVEDKGELDTFKLTEPGWVPWDYQDEITAYLVLFNDSGPLKNFEMIQVATGWNGADFTELATLVGKTIMFRTQENSWEGKVSIQVNWVDSVEASPTRQLKQADAPTIAAANSKWLAGRKAPPKPTVAVAKPSVSASPASPAAAAAPATPAATATASPPSAPAKNPPGRKPKKDQTPALPAPTGCTLAEAWEAVSSESARGKVELTEVEDMWITHLNVIAKDVPDDKVTPEQYAATRDAVLAEIATKNGK
jgi:hypothetical protein